MKLAFIISVYKYPEQFIRLLNRLQADTANFLVHVDKRSPREFFAQIQDGTKHLANVYLLKRYRCYWGDFGHVQATIAGINELLKSKIPFDYAILLTGQDYPIKTNGQIQEYLQQSNGKSFMEYFPLPHTQWEGGGSQRFEQWHVRLFGHHYVFPRNSNALLKRKFPNGFKPFGGSSYWCLSRECIDYLYNFIKHHRKFVNYFRYVDVPDELIFQTIILNSPLAEYIVNDNARYINWKDLDSGSPAILDRSDFERLAQSPKLFARKFDLTVDSEILDMIDNKIV